MFTRIEIKIEQQESIRHRALNFDCNEARLWRGAQFADVYRHDNRWYYEKHSSHHVFFVGRWLSWRLERARRKLVASVYWSKLPEAKALP